MNTWFDEVKDRADRAVFKGEAPPEPLDSWRLVRLIEILREGIPPEDFDAAVRRLTYIP